MISPWTKGGVEVPTRYDQYSVMAAIEKILGLDPLSINDARTRSTRRAGG